MGEVLPFLDTNILLRHLAQDHPDHSPRATAYLSRVEAGEIRVRTADTVVFEAVFTLQRHYGLPRARIRDILLPLLQLPGIVLPGKRHLPDVFDLYVSHSISFVDAYHASLTRRTGITEIVSFDEDFDKIAGVHRIEP
ncbi:MAG: PIN domain-containing protein [Armatimonadetes bacterium]|nr:PIN domain-containing protein [Armatimonadota bacterium]